MQGSTAKNILRWVALGALFLVPLTPLIVINSLFFPFITGKAFYFRIIVEIGVVAWVALACIDKAYRPRFSWIGGIVILFVAWMFVADLFALNVAKAFWSNFERMEGWVLLIHLLGFFFAISTMLRVEKKWRWWFFTSLGIGVLVSLYSFLQLAGVLQIHQGSTRIDATFGNSAYLAIYLLFNIFIAGWLALTESRTWLKYSLVVFAFIQAFLIFMTETRGTVLGLTGALFLAALLTAYTARNKNAKRYATGALAVIVILAGGFYLARNSAVVQGNDVLQRIASISLSDGQTRFTIWHMAFEGFLERPVVGWGQEGFNYVFNQFYEPSLYQQEQWFDRAHDAFIDWLVDGGLPAFVLYLGLFASALWFLWRSPSLSRPERIALTGALVGYAVHNLFVFDNLYSYIYFFAILALIDSQIARPVSWLERAPEISASDGVAVALPVALVVAGGLIWWVNVPGIRAATELITAITPSADGSITSNLATFEDLVQHPAFASQEIREQLVTFASSAVQDTSATDAQKQQLVSLAVSQMQAQVAAYPRDAREQLELAYAYQAGGDSADALKQIQIAETLSPDKESILIEAGVTEWDLNDPAAAQVDFDKAYALGPEFTDLAAYAAAGDYGNGDTAQGDAVLLSAYGTTTVDSDVLAAAYYNTQDWPRLIALWRLRASEPSASLQTLFALAAAYYAAGQKENAIKAVEYAVAQYPDAAATGQAAIAQIEGSTTPE